LAVKLPTTCVVASATEVAKDPDLEVIKKSLWRLVENSGSTLNVQQKHHLFNLLLGFADVFAMNDNQMGRTNKLQRSINTGDHQPIRQQVRRIPPCKREEVHQLLQDMLKRKVIQSSSSPWGSPVVPVKKKDGST